MTESNNEKPILVLKQNRKLLKWTICFIIGIVALAFSDVVSVIVAGSYSAVGDDFKRYEQIFLFWGSVYFIPFIIYIVIMGLRHFGDFSLYSDRLEFQSFWFNRKTRLSYNEMYIESGSIGLSITSAPLPSKWHPVKRFRAVYNSMFVPAGIYLNDNLIGNFRWGLSKRYLNPQDGPKAVKILREKAFSVK